MSVTYAEGRTRQPAGNPTRRQQTVAGLSLKPFTPAPIVGPPEAVGPGEGRVRDVGPVDVRVGRPGRPSAARQWDGVTPGSTAWQNLIRGRMDKLSMAGVPKTVSVAGWGPLEKIARKYLGIPYRWGGTNPKVGLDCSGYMQLIFAQIGIKLPRVSRDQARVGQTIKGGLRNARPGDLVFYANSSGRIYHVGMYAGFRNGKHTWYVAPRTGDVVKLGTISTSKVAVVKRVLGGR